MPPARPRRPISSCPTDSYGGTYRLATVVHHRAGLARRRRRPLHLGRRSCDPRRRAWSGWRTTDEPAPLGHRNIAAVAALAHGQGANRRRRQHLRHPVDPTDTEPGCRHRGALDDEVPSVGIPTSSAGSRPPTTRTSRRAWVACRTRRGRCRARSTVSWSSAGDDASPSGWKRQLAPNASLAVVDTVEQATPAGEERLASCRWPPPGVQRGWQASGRHAGVRREWSASRCRGGNEPRARGRNAHPHLHAGREPRRRRKPDRNIRAGYPRQQPPVRATKVPDDLVRPEHRTGVGRRPSSTTWMAPSIRCAEGSSAPVSAGGTNLVERQLVGRPSGRIGSTGGCGARSGATAFPRG